MTPPGPSPVCDLGTLTCDLGDLPSGATVELLLDVAVAGDLDPGASVSNTATVATQTSDPNTDDNTSTFTVSSDPHADVSVRKLPPAGSPIAGDTSAGSLPDRSFRIEIANFGPSATGSFTDSLPPGMTFRRIYDFDNPDVDLTPLLNCSVTGTPATGPTVSCSPPFDLDPFVGVFFALEFSVDATIPDGTLLENAIAVDTTVPDGNPGNNTSTALVAVRAEVNLTVEKLVVPMDANGDFVPGPQGEIPYFYPRAQDPLGVAPGLPVSFAVIVTNQGPSAAADVEFIDASPLDAAYFPVGDCDFLNGETVCPNPAELLLPGDSFGVQIIAVLDGDTPQGVYANTARASTSTDETTLADNVDTRPIEVIDPVADLIIEKDDVTSALAAGESFTYQIAVSAGRIDLANGVLRLSSDAADVVVTDSLPAGLVPAAATSSQGSCTVDGQNVTCELGTVGSSISLERQVPPTLITVTGRVAPSFAAAEVTNTATATSSAPLLSGEDDVSASTTTPVTRSADLAVTKVASSPTAPAGGGITFTVTVTNTGPSDATGVVITDLLPAPLEFDQTGSDAACTPSGGDVACDIGTVAAGDSDAVTLAATLPSGAAAGSVTNTATVTADVPDPNADDNQASVDVAVTHAAHLVVTKTPATEAVLLGDTMPYTLVVANDGPSDATGVVLTETIPAGTTVGTLPAGCSVPAPPSAGPVTCDIGAITAGDTRTLELVLTFPDTLSPGPLDNLASVTSDTDDPDQSDNQALATVEAVADADVTLTQDAGHRPADRRTSARVPPDDRQQRSHRRPERDHLRPDPPGHDVHLVHREPGHVPTRSAGGRAGGVVQPGADGGRGDPDGDADRRHRSEPAHGRQHRLRRFRRARREP